MKILLRAYQETLAASLRDFSRGEKLLIIDVFNGTLLTGLLMGDQIIAQVEDGIRLDGLDKKWEIEAPPMIKKLRVLSPWARGCLEIWANEYWYGHSGELADIEDYVKYAPPLLEALERAAAKLDTAIDLLKKSRDAFKSKTIAQARAAVDDARGILRAI